MAPEVNTVDTTSKHLCNKPRCPFDDASNREPSSSVVINRKVTKPEPFHFATEQRGAVHSQLQETKRSMEDKQLHSAQDARAHPLLKSTDMPMRPPKPLSRQLTVPEPFEFASDERCRQRVEFDRKIQVKMLEAELAAQQAAEEARVREEEERLQLRKATVFRARPMPDLSPEPLPKPAPKPTTRPVSPRLGRTHRRNST